MKKLRLDVDQLTVESFHVHPLEEGQGTIRANADAAGGIDAEKENEKEMAAGCSIGWTDVVSFALFGTCDYSCNETCKATCANTCATCAATCPASCGGAVPTGCDLPYCWANPTTKPVGS